LGWVGAARRPADESESGSSGSAIAIFRSLRLCDPHPYPSPQGGGVRGCANRNRLGSASEAEHAATAADTGGAGAGDLIVAVEAEGALIGLARLGLLALLLEGEAAAGPGGGIAVVDIERGGEVLERRVVFAERVQALARAI
jgi:hypothetical protein